MSWLSCLKSLFCKNCSKKDLLFYRKKIDKIDAKIFKYLKHRSQIVAGVKKFKLKTVKNAIFIKSDRELEMLAKIEKSNFDNNYGKDFYKHFLRYVISASNQLEQSNFTAIYFDDSSLNAIAVYYGLFCNFQKYSTLLDCIKNCNNCTVLFVPQSYIISIDEQKALDSKQMTIFAQSKFVNDKIENNFIMATIL